MLPVQTQTRSPALVYKPAASDRAELSRLLATAVVNRQFCQQLLNDPDTALQNGYQGEPFLLTQEEQALILSIRADSLTDLAQQLVRTFDARPSYAYATNSLPL